MDPHPNSVYLQDLNVDASLLKLKVLRGIQLSPFLRWIFHGSISHLGDFFNAQLILWRFLFYQHLLSRPWVVAAAVGSINTLNEGPFRSVSASSSTSTHHTALAIYSVDTCPVWHWSALVPCCSTTVTPYLPSGKSFSSFLAVLVHYWSF